MSDSSSSSSAAGKDKEINLHMLNLEQLNMLKKQLEEETSHLTESLQQLRLAATRYIESKEAISTLENSNGKPILVPLTSSLYVPGKVGDSNHVLVDVGTGYVVRKTLPEANEFADRKVKMIQENMSKVQQAIGIKRNNLEAVLTTMQMKIEQMEASQSSGAQPKTTKAIK
eukprot:TRINITY_DN1726_c0_g1_i2.p1 TRINITY_DN1726_c0_g1~~TRINITY_DN1726_c0_g1_i2.p1  ORF type:complete len:171 (+),score=43.24 TRINITY_DN1726_c0_g1_i2:161-673(+)